MRRLISFAVFCVVAFLISAFANNIFDKPKAEANLSVNASDNMFVATGGLLNEPAPGVLANDSLPPNDPITDLYQTTLAPHHRTQFVSIQGNVHYTPQGYGGISPYVGTDEFLYYVKVASGANDTAKVTLIVTPPDGAENAGRSRCGGNYPSNVIGKPVNVTNGNMWLEQTDYSLPGIGENIEINRFYNSIIQTNGHFGRGWSTKYDESLIYYDAQMLRLNMPDGRAVYFGRTTTSAPFVSAMRDFHGQIVINADTSYTLTFKDGRVHQFIRFQLQKYAIKVQHALAC